MALRPETTFERSDDAVFGAIDRDQGVIMSVTSGKLYELNAVAGRLWELLETPSTLSALCQAIRAEFQVDAATCEREVAVFAAEMVDRGLLRTR